MTKEQEIIESEDGELTSEQIEQLWAGDEGDTGDKSETGSQPEASIDDDEDKPGDDTATEGEGEESQQEEVDEVNEDELNADNAVVLAKDGIHTISYDKLVSAREGERQAKAAAEAAQQELEALKAQAQQRADEGEAPTETDNKVAAAEQAIDDGADPELFGDFSEEALTKGIQTLVDRRIVAEMGKINSQLEPIQQRDQKNAQSEHYKAIYKAHPDADSLAESQELDDWINSHPSFVRKGYSAVLEDGNTEQVIELFSAFKEANPRQDEDDKAGQEAAPNDIKAQAKAAVDKAPKSVPASLSDFPGGNAGAATREESMANMDGAQMIDALADMDKDQIERYMNSI